MRIVGPFSGDSRAMRSHILALAVLFAAGLLASPAEGFIETHLNEINVPVADAVADRVVVLDAKGDLAKNEKKERSRLAKLAKKLAKKPARKLGDDFKNLKKAGSTAKKLGIAVISIENGLDETFGLAELALGERRALVQDHLVLITDLKHVGKVNKILEKYGTARAFATTAEAASDHSTRSKQLGKAEVAVTKALKKAEKFAQQAVNADRTGELSMPPVRLRSGDDVGAGGARIAIPDEADSPVARASVLIPPGALGALSRITIEPAADIVGGRDVPVGPAVRFLPAGTQFSQLVTVSVPYALPDGANADDLAVFHFDGVTTDPTLAVIREPNLTVSAQFDSFSEFQAGLLAPPLGAPAGTYQTEMFVVLHRLDALDQDETDRRVEIFEQAITFRADDTGTAGIGAAPIIARGFLSAVPHHDTVAFSSLLGSFEFEWTQVGDGIFTFVFPAAGEQVAANGVVSTDGSVLAYTGHTDEFDFFAVGVRKGTAVTTADLAGRWFGVELGARFGNRGTEPFSTRWHAAYTAFDADGTTGDLTFDAGGEIFQRDVRYDTDLATPAHVVTTQIIADSGVQNAIVLPDGSLTSPDLKFRGQFNADAGAMVAATIDLLDYSVSLMIAAKQPATVPANTFQGDYHFARIDLEPRQDDLISTTSHLDVETGNGLLSVDGGGLAALVLDPLTRATYTISGLPPLSNMTWTSTGAVQVINEPVANFALSLDAAGNHRGDPAARYYGVSGDGNIVLSIAPGELGRVLRGIGIGLK